MSLIKNTVANNRVVEVEYDQIPGFKIQLQYLTREELNKIRTASLKKKINRQTRQMEDDVDNDKFLKLYTERAIVGWTGLKVKHLPQLYPANISGLNPEEEVPFSPEDAFDLTSASPDFDQFVTNCMRDIEVFNQNTKDAQTKK
jgi:hypothetical protein